MAKKTKRARGSRFADDAALQAIVRYEPEESGLKALAQQARADYGVSVRQAQTTGDLTLQAAREAIPSVSRIYDQAGLDQAKTANLVSPELAALSGPGAATLQRGGALEVAQQLGNLRSAKAAALEDLQTRAVAARQGQQFGVLNARQKFTADMAKILGQSQSLQRQKGAFQAATIGSMTEAALGRELSARNSARSARTSAANSRRSQSQSERNSLRQSGVDPDTGKPIPGGKLDPKVIAAKNKPKPQSPAAHGRVKDQISSIQSWIKSNKADYGSRHEMAADLVQGVPASTIKVDSKGNPLPAPVRDPGVPKAPSTLAASIALDLEFDGHVSRRNIEELHKRRLSLRQLGFKGAAGTKPRPKPVRPVARRRRGSSGAIPGLGNISFQR